MKLIFGIGIIGSILTTEDSTLGGGLKEFLETFIMWSHFERSWTFTLSQQYIFDPGFATSLNANSY